MAEFLAVIPARYASSRFPGKPLAMIAERPMIQWVYESASTVFDHIVVATEDDRILEVVENFGGNAMMTSSRHRSGTERCAEALKKYCRREDRKISHVVNIQGDEPLIKAEQLMDLIHCFDIPETEIATLVRPLKDLRELDNPNVVKAVVDKDFRALYFSRAAIPYMRDQTGQRPGSPFYSHIGLYAYRSEILLHISRLAPTPLETAELLEQLRWLENGFRIQTRITRHHSPGVDTPADLERIRERL